MVLAASAKPASPEREGGCDILTVSYRSCPPSQMDLGSPSAPIAQLDRASGYEPGGRTFESCWAHQNPKKIPSLSNR
jgi:hypothetical protein